MSGIYCNTKSSNGFIERFLPVYDNDSEEILSDEIIGHSEFTFKRHQDGPFHLNYDNRKLSISIKQYIPDPWKSTIFSFLCALLLISFLFLFSDWCAKQTNGWIALFIGFIAVRLATALFSQNSVLKDTTFFSDSNYLNLINPTLGDFVLNSLFFLIFTIGLSRFSFKKKPTGIIGTSLTLIFINLMFLEFVSICQGLVFNTGVNLDIDLILTFDKYSILAIVSLFLFGFGIFLASHSLLGYSQNLDLKTKIWSLGISLLISIFLLSIVELNLNSILILTFLSAYYLLFDLFREKKQPGLIWAIWWIMLFSALLSSLLFSYSLKKRNIDRARFLNTLYYPLDQNQNTVVSGFFDQLDSLPTTRQIGSGELRAGLDKNDVLDYLKTTINQFDLNEFNLGLEIYDGLGNSIFRKNFLPRGLLDKSLSQSDLLQEDLYYNPFEGMYLRHYTVVNDNFPQNRLDFYYILSKEASNSNSTSLSYSIFKNDIELSSHKESQYYQDADPFKSLDEGNYVIDGISILVKEPVPGTKIISSEKLDNLLKPISLFSFIFCLFGASMFLMTLLNNKFGFLHEDLRLKLKSANTLKGRIQLAFILLIIFSFLLIGFITVFYFSNVLTQSEERRVEIQIEAIKNDIEDRISEAIGNIDSRVIVNNSLRTLSEVHNAEFSLFNQHGVLERSLNSNANPLMEFEVFQRLKQNPQRVYIDQHSDRHSTSFIPLLSPNLKPYAFLKVDHQTSNVVQSRIIDFISTILNVYVFLFLLAGAIALSIADSITRPLQRLAEKIKTLTLGRKNEKLEWQRNDEIGALIEEYNRMILKLEESATVLARTERDTAWREMAKQVAHEIKNPLTPMKLNVQYLQRALEADPDRAQAMIGRVSHTLIEQIDNLSKIASEFSHFAKMPIATNEKVILNEIVENVHDLFRKREDMDIRMTEPIDDIYVFADRGQLIRVLTNLIKNAIQAIPEDRRGLIEVDLKKENQRAFISVKDNGQGIPIQMRDKVFRPNFTTKNSGTGLGLAISSNIIESLDGQISFVSTINEGTIFTIELPLMRLEANKGDDNNRVSLD